MKISLDNISKKFQRHWIFRSISISFTQPGSYALLGPNGSGKSTLLRIIGGMQTPSSGKVVHEIDGREVEGSRIFAHISFCAPGMDIVEELTLNEFLEFHFGFKRPVAGLSVRDIVELSGLAEAANRPIAEYSSGMKQRVKLLQAICSETPCLLLDEPCTNLDDQGVAQYRSWLNVYARDRLVIIASNDPREYSFCGETLTMQDYK